MLLDAQDHTGVSGAVNAAPSSRKTLHLLVSGPAFVGPGSSQRACAAPV